MPEKPVGETLLPTTVADAPSPAQPSSVKPGAGLALGFREEKAVGQLIAAGFSVTCGMCRSHTWNTIADGLDYVGTTKRVAGRILRRAGWDKSSIWGWICPRCVKVGCASRQPGFEPHSIKKSEPRSPNCSLMQEA